jgi:hypothetical protein
MSFRPLIGSALVLSLLAPSLAAAEETTGLGRNRHVVVGADLAGVVDYSSVTTKTATGAVLGQQEVEGSAWEIHLRPAVDYFIDDNFSVGVSLLYSSFSLDYPGEESDAEESSMGAGLRGGVLVDLAERVSVWTRIGAEYRESERRERGLDLPDVDTFSFGMDGVLVFDLAPHLFLGAGPRASFTSDHIGEGLEVERFTVGLRLEVGGYW